MRERNTGEHRGRSDGLPTAGEIARLLPLYEQYVFNAHAALAEKLRGLIPPEQLGRVQEIERECPMQTFAEWLEGEAYCRERVVRYLKGLCRCSIPEEDDDEVHGAEQALGAFGAQDDRKEQK